jgi:hypothetical protein
MLLVLESTFTSPVPAESVVLAETEAKGTFSPPEIVMQEFKDVYLT